MEYSSSTSNVLLQLITKHPSIPPKDDGQPTITPLLSGPTRVDNAQSKRKGEGFEKMSCVAMREHNRSPKGNIWSAIPVALLCMIVNWSERKQGSGPEGDEVL